MTGAIVSVVVVSFNSAETIGQTLESIVNQTFDKKKIEVVFADDNSSDDTTEIVLAWIKKNHHLFYDVKYSFAKKNGGVAINCNSGWKLATGIWIKSIAADDILLSSCIADNFSYAEEKRLNIIFSKMRVFNNNILSERFLPSEYEINILNGTCEGQLEYLNVTGISGAPTVFMRRSALHDIGYADESFPMIEDYPLWLKFVKSGIKLDYMDKITVLYRVDESISRSQKRIVNIRYFNDLYRFDNREIIHADNINYFVKVRKIIWYFSMFTLIKMTGNTRNRFSNLICKLLLVIKPGALTQAMRRGN